MNATGKRSHKLRSMGDVSAVVASSRNLNQAARRLGVNRSTLTRWVQQGKVTAPAPAAAVVAPVSVEGWKDGVLAQHVLSDTEQTLVDVADQALRVARDMEAPAFTRLSAMGRFAAIVRQLNLETKRVEAQAEKPSRSMPAIANARPRRLVGDPRAVLMAVK